MPILLSISGPDGSGKSTQIELLKNCLRSQGKSFYYFHAVEFSIGNLCQKPKVKSQNIGSVTKANWLKIQLRKLALMIDTCRFNRLLKKLKVDYIISDRYFYDTVVNINYLEAELPSEAKAIFQAVRNKDKITLKFMEELGKINGRGISNVIAAYDPGIIILGGAVALSSGDLVLRYAKKNIDKFLRLPEIKISNLGENAPLLGAAAMVLNKQ